MKKRRENLHDTITKLENRKKVLDAILDAKCSGLYRKDLPRKAGIKHPRVLRKHIEALKEKRLITENQRRLYGTEYFNKLRIDALPIGDIWLKLSNQMFGWAKTNNLIPENTNYAEFFSQHGVLFYPEKTEKSFKMRFVFCSAEKHASGSQAFKLGLLWDV
jgi:hypothetical protein